MSSKFADVTLKNFLSSRTERERETSPKSNTNLSVKAKDENNGSQYFSLHLKTKKWIPDFTFSRFPIFVSVISVRDEFFWSSANFYPLLNKKFFGQKTQKKFHKLATSVRGAVLPPPPPPILLSPSVFVSKSAFFSLLMRLQILVLP